MKAVSIIKKFPILAAILFIIAACSHEEAEYQLPKFAKTEKAKVEFLGEELLMAPSDIVVVGDYIVISGYDTRSGNTLFVFDKSGTPIKSGIKHGRAKGETMAGYLYISFDGENVIYHDIMTKEFMSFRLEDFLAKDQIDVDIRPFDYTSWINYAGETRDGKHFYLRNRGPRSNADIPTRSVLVYDRDGECYSFDGSPIEDPHASFTLHIQPRMAASVDGKHLALSSTNGAILEIFDISEGIERTSIGKFIEPEYEKIGRDLLPADNLLLGFGDSFASDEGVYIVYDDKYHWGDLGPGCTLPAFSNIAFFDWKGKPQKLIKTGYRMRSICYDSGKFYAVLNTPDGYRLAMIE